MLGIAFERGVRIVTRPDALRRERKHDDGHRNGHRARAPRFRGVARVVGTVWTLCFHQTSPVKNRGQSMLPLVLPVTAKVVANLGAHGNASAIADSPVMCVMASAPHVRP